MTGFYFNVINLSVHQWVIKKSHEDCKYEEKVKEECYQILQYFATKILTTL